MTFSIRPSRRSLLWVIYLIASLLLIGGNALADNAEYQFIPGPNPPEDFKPGPGVDATGLDLSGSRFIGMDLDGAKFDGCNLRYAYFLEVGFGEEGASFRDADLRNAQFITCYCRPTCDFSNAMITDLVWHSPPYMTVEQLRSTRSYKMQDLSGVTIGGKYPRNGEEPPKVTLDLQGFDLRRTLFCYGDFTECDFTGANTEEVRFKGAKVTQAQLKVATPPCPPKCVPGRSTFGKKLNSDGFGWEDPKGYRGMVFWNMDLSGWDSSKRSLEDVVLISVNLDSATFERADIRGTAFGGGTLTLEQLRETKSYGLGDFSGAYFSLFDFSDFDFSGFNLSGCKFYYCNFGGADFTDAVVTDVDFHHHSGTPLTVEQIKSTWNYKHDRMDTVILPKSLAEEMAE